MDDTSTRRPPAASMRLMVIMFTDLVGSTQLKEQIGAEQYRRLKERHDNFITQALAIAPSGKVLQDIGDGYFLSFSSVGHAVSAALLFQWLMTRETWPHPFKSRVGVHLGEVEEGHSQVTGQADFISSAIDQASRTMSLAVGGQILLTRTVYESARSVVREHPPVADAPTPKLAWMAHGAYLFKGCTDAVDVFEVGAKDLAPLIPPPDSEKAKRAGVPANAYPATNEIKAATPRPTPAEPAPVAPRRSFLKAALIGVPALTVAGGAGYLFSQRPDEGAKIKRRNLEEQVVKLKEKPPLIARTLADVKEVDRVLVGDNAAFDILSDNRVVDLRGWKEVPQDRLGERVSQVTLMRRLQLMKNVETSTFEMQARTSGLDVNLACNSDYPCTYEAQKGESFVGQERMKVRKVAVDVSKVGVGVEFILNLQVTYWNSLQTQAEQWFGLIGYPKSFVTTLLAVFPEGRPFKTYSLTVSKTEKDAPVEYTGLKSLMMGDARDWIHWEVPHPEAGHVYRLHWTW
jgi:class 3 adenylate cyclase